MDVNKCKTEARNGYEYEPALSMYIKIEERKKIKEETLLYDGDLLEAIASSDMTSAMMIVHYERDVIDIDDMRYAIEANIEYQDERCPDLIEAMYKKFSMKDKYKLEYIGCHMLMISKHYKSIVWKIDIEVDETISLFDDLANDVFMYSKEANKVLKQYGLGLEIGIDDHNIPDQMDSEEYFMDYNNTLEVTLKELWKD